METLVPDKFRAEVESHGVGELDGLRSAVATACGAGSPEEDVIRFLGESGWSRQFSEWLFVQASAYGHELRLKFPEEPILVTETREFDEWASRKRLLFRRGVFWLAFGLILRLAGFYLFGSQNVGGGDPGLTAVCFFAGSAMMLFGAYGVLRSKGHKDWTQTFLGAFTVFFTDKNKRTPPRAKHEKGSSAFSDW